MASIARHVHPFAEFDFGPIDRFAPDLGMRGKPAEEGGEAPIPNAVAFRDPDGETHVYVISDEGRTALMKCLSGGIIIAGSI